MGRERLAHGAVQRRPAGRGERPDEHLPDERVGEPHCRPASLSTPACTAGRGRPRLGRGTSAAASTTSTSAIGPPMAAASRTRRMGAPSRARFASMSASRPSGDAVEPKSGDPSRTPARFSRGDEVAEGLAEVQRVARRRAVQRRHEARVLPLVPAPVTASTRSPMSSMSSPPARSPRRGRRGGGGHEQVAERRLAELGAAGGREHPHRHALGHERARSAAASAGRRRGGRRAPRAAAPRRRSARGSG